MAWLATAVAGIGGAPAWADAPAPRLARVEVLDSLELHPALPGGHRLREVSGLAWDERDNQLVTVSDRGLVVRWMLEIEHDRLVSAWPVLAQPLVPGARVDAESVEVLPLAARSTFGGGHLVVVDEKRAELIVSDARGRAIASSALPGALMGSTKRRKNNGVEGIAWHRGHGLIAAAQRTWRADGSPAGEHRIMAADGHYWDLAPAPGDATTLRALHLVDEARLLVLEKRSDGKQRRFFLREIDLASCGGARVCDAAPVAVDPRALADGDNFEGLACIDAERCFIVSDNGGGAASRSVLVLLGLVRGARP
jgi:hypothetical protein